MLNGHTNFLQSLGWAVVNSLWQMALLWVIYQLIIAFIKPLKAPFKSSLASFLLMAGFAWFLYTFASAFFGDVASGKQIIITAILSSGERQLSWLQFILSFASVAYLILLVFPVIHFIRNYRYVQVIRNYGLEKMDVQWRIFVQKMAARMDIRKKVKLWASEFVTSPVTVGFLKPVILVPIAAINQLTPQQMEAVLLHELSHIRRYDYLVNLIISFIKAILYFNPFVKAFTKIVESEREKSCDEMVLQFQYNSFEYAAALLTLEKTNHTRKTFFIAASGKKNDLLHRVELILGVPQRNSFARNKISGFLAAFICIFSLNALLHLNKPQNGFTAGSFVNHSPFSGITDASESTSINKWVNESVKTVANKNELKENAAPEVLIPGINNPAFMNAGFVPVEMPVLKNYEEEQIKEALEKSKKVFEDEEWKAMERNVAEVLTQKEKEELRASYKKELNKLDWNKWEDKLRLAYDKVNWSQVNEELSLAVNAIRLDSLQKVYTEALCKLDKAKAELVSIEVNSFIDADNTAKAIDASKQQLRKIITTLKAVRNKKIVHL